MARLPYLNKEDLAESDRDLLTRPININRTLVHSPGGRRAGLGLANYIRHGSKLDPRLRELAIMQVGYLTRSAYEWSHHVKIGHEFGVSDDDINGLIKTYRGEPSKFDEVTTVVLAAAREMTLDGTISEATFATLRKHFDNERLVDLVVAIAHYNGIVRVLAAFAVDVEDEYKPYLEKFPLPA